MQVARQRLIDTGASIIDIAGGVGYQSESAFGRIFIKHFGIAPASYRRNRTTVA
jgi:transcriptional regulator GlxA family with amidase domain